MPRPRRIRIGHTIWKVLWSQRSVDRLAGGGAIGVSVEKAQTMAVAGDLVAMFERETFLHELMHSCISAAGVAPASEELLVSVLAPRLLGVLRQNPGVVEFLLEDDE